MVEMLKVKLCHGLGVLMVGKNDEMTMFVYLCAREKPSKRACAPLLCCARVAVAACGNSAPPQAFSIVVISDFATW